MAECLWHMLIPPIIYREGDGNIVLLCESAEQFRALMVILQYH